MLISKEYAELNRKMHEERDDYGRSSEMWCGFLDKLAEEEKFTSILDYGAGKGEIKRRLPHLPIAEYDPAIPGKDVKPEPADLVVCTDVLEHIEPVHINAVLRDLKRCTKRKLFFAICTLKSSKTLADGRNAHLIIQGETWWRERLGRHFRILSVRNHLGTIFGEALPLTGAERKPDTTRRRRAMTNELGYFLDHIVAHSKAHSDGFSRINDWNVFEDLPDDRPADLQAVMNVLDNVPDADLMMRKVMKLARKAVLATVQIKHEGEEAQWRKFFEQFIRISDWLCQNDGIVVIGSPAVAVEGITAVGVVASDDRWEQVLAATYRVTKRIEPMPAHDKHAIIVCYGPSLQATVGDIHREIAKSDDATVFSVSGAHDFLVENGITPDYHVECDPRAHKADNIDKPIAGVKYLIGSACHTAMFDKLAGADVRLWHISTPEHHMRLINELGESNEYMISGGGSVGLRSIPVAYAMGYRKFTIYGMDCSFGEPSISAEERAEIDALLQSSDVAAMHAASERLGERISQWAGKHAGKRQDVCQVSCGDRIFFSSPILLTYASGFFETIQKVGDCTFKVVGDGLLQSMCELYSKMPQLAEAA